MIFFINESLSLELEGAHANLCAGVASRFGQPNPLCRVQLHLQGCRQVGCIAKAKDVLNNHLLFQGKIDKSVVFRECDVNDSNPLVDCKIPNKSQIDKDKAQQCCPKLLKPK